MFVASLALLIAQASTPLAEMDFDLYGHLIHVPVKVNGHPAIAVLDTGASTAVMSIGLANDWKLESNGQVPLSGIGNKGVTGKLLSGVNAEIGGVKTPIRVALPLDGLAPLSGRNLEIVIGYEFFSTHIVDIDYPHHHLKIYSPDADVPNGGAHLPISFERNLIHATAEMAVGGKNYSLNALIDTGAGGCGGLSAPFVRQNPLSVQKTPKAVIGGGVGGTIEGSYFRPDSLKFAGVSFAKPVMSLSEATGGASGATSTYDVLLGGELFQRFRLTVDYPHKQLAFEPGSDIAKPFEADKTGLRVLAEGPDLHSYRISDVQHGSSAEAAGLKVNDVIVSVDGRLSSSFDLQALREMFRSPDVQGWDLEISRGGVQQKVHVVAKSVI